MHPQNVLFSIPGMDRWPLEEIDKIFGAPRGENVRREDGKPLTRKEARRLPRYQVFRPNPQKLLELGLENPKAVRVKIIDFGESILWDGAPVQREMGIPRIYAAPEILMNGAIGPGVDTWAFAIMAHCLLTGDEAVFGWAWLPKEEEILEEIASALGSSKEEKGIDEWVGRGRLLRREYDGWKFLLKGMLKLAPMERMPMNLARDVLSGWKYDGFSASSQIIHL